jgi:hypothetical protein
MRVIVALAMLALLWPAYHYESAIEIHRDSASDRISRACPSGGLSLLIADIGEVVAGEDVVHECRIRNTALQGAQLRAASSTCRCPGAENGEATSLLTHLPLDGIYL